MSWTDERIEKLTKMWEGGSTASQIAEELGGVSRNAVIGKAHRLGLKARPSPVKANDGKSEDVRASDVGADDVRADDGAEPVVTEPKNAVAATPIQPLPAVTTSLKTAPAQTAPAQTATTQTATAQTATAQTATAQTASAGTGASPQPAAPPAAATISAPAPIAPPVADIAPTPGSEPQPPLAPRIVSVGPGGFLRQGPGDQQAPIPPAPPRRLVPAKPSADISGKTSLLDLNDRICRWPMGHPGEADFHFCGVKVNPGFPYCVAHCGRAYQAQLPRGHRRPPPPLPFGGPRVR